jgi:uncharacterized LabA/DUF88 family protein/uncharacterized protein YqfB (UPF0267 family)
MFSKKIKKETVAVYIDGGNTYRKLKKVGIPENSRRFDFSAFVTHLVGDRHLVSKRYYVGIVKNFDNSEKSEKLVKSQQRFLEGLRSEGFEIKPGKIMYDDGRIREKGVDVKLAVDLVIGAAGDVCDTAIVISSDTDLIPAIKYVRNGKKKNVEYIGFDAKEDPDKSKSTPSFGLMKESSVSRIFSKTDLVQFQIKTLKFMKELADLILKGEKTVTWRLFDDKELRVDDILNLQISETGKDFAKAKIVDVREKKLGEVDAEDYVGHEGFSSQDEMLKTYKGYYGDKVNLDTQVKIIKFSLPS